MPPVSKPGTIKGAVTGESLGHSEFMYSMDNLLHLLHSDGADELRLRVGEPPVIVLEGEQQPLEGPAITTEDAEQLLVCPVQGCHQRPQTRGR